MRNINTTVIGLALLCAVHPASAGSLPPGFVHLRDVAPDIQQDLRYASSNNFIGRPVNGYHAPRCILTREAAEALARVQASLAPRGMSLKVYDCYRPQRAVDDFIQWASQMDEQSGKAAYYPRVDKSQLFEQGYIARRSGHSRGSTIDLTLLVQAPDKTWAELDMGSAFDLFDPLSHTDQRELPQQARANRDQLRALMQGQGFYNLALEWWHYTLTDEPHTLRYFDFSVD